MGRQAKLKQLKRQASENPSKEALAPKPDFTPTQFVQQLETSGYKLQQAQHSPEVPHQNQPTPQL